MKEKIRCSIGLIQSEDSKELYIERIKEPYLGCYEFPGGKIQTDETPESAIIRELNEELGIQVKKLSFIGKVFHDYPEFTVILHVFFISNYNGEIKNTTRNLCYRRSSELDKDFKTIDSCLKVLKLCLLLPKIKILDCEKNLFKESCLSSIKKTDTSFKMIRFRNLETAENSQINNIKHFTKENPYNYIIDHPSEKNFDGKFFGIHFKSKYLYTLKSVPKDMILYSGSCHNFDEVEQANRLELDYILISPVQISKHSNQKILGWEGFERLSLKANMPTYALGGISHHKSDYKLSLKHGGFGIAGIKNF